MGIQRRHFLQRTGGLALAALIQARPVEAAEEGFCSLNGARLDPVSYTHLTLPTNREV